MEGFLPLLLDEGALCRMLGMQSKDTRCWVAGGALPAAQTIFGLTRWHRGQVQDRLAQLYGLDTADRLIRDEKAKMEAILVEFEKHARAAKAPRPKKF